MPVNTLKIHNVFFLEASKLTVLALTSEYSVELSNNPQSGQASEIKISRSTEKHPGVSLNLASFTTLFGENGSGKTDLLLTLCQGLAAWTPKSRLSLLWEDEHGLKLALSDSLKKVPVQPPFEGTVHKKAPAITTAFYTTSPFESLRRARLKARGVLDISPRFGSQVSFDAPSTFLAYELLRNRAPFVANAEVEMKASIPELFSLLKTYSFPSVRKEVSQSASLRDNIVKAASRGLDQEERFALSFIILDSAENDTAGELYSFTDELREMLYNHSASATQPSADTWSKFSYLATTNTDLRKRYQEAFNGYQLICALFEDKESWRRTAKISFLDEKIGNLIRGNAELVAKLTKLGFLRWSFHELSSGQASMMSLYCSLAMTLGAFEKDSDASALLLCIDEGEMFMHPRWQREYISHLLEFIHTFPGAASKLHLLVSTHSLIVAADSPPGRLFDLEEKRLKNAFGYSPKQTLSGVFNVEEFSGDYSAGLIAKISDTLKSKHPTDEQRREALQIARSLSNDDVREQVEHRLHQHLENLNAQD